MSNDNQIPPGWSLYTIRSNFSQTIAPTYIRNEPIGIGFFADEPHLNSNGVVHGGALATLADMALFRIASGSSGRMKGATMTLNINYLKPGQAGHFIHSEGRIVKEGSTVIFVEGSLLADTDELVTFNGVVKRFG